MGPTLDAATSWAVLAAISWEHTISSSNFPLPCTTRSAASLTLGKDKEDYVTVEATTATSYEPTSRPLPSPGQPGSRLPAPILCCFRRPRLLVLLTFLSTVYLRGGMQISSLSYSLGWINGMGVGVRSLGTDRHLHHDSGSPAHSFRG